MEQKDGEIPPMPTPTYGRIIGLAEATGSLAIKMPLSLCSLSRRSLLLLFVVDDHLRSVEAVTAWVAVDITLVSCWWFRDAALYFGIAQFLAPPSKPVHKSHSINL